MASKPRKRDKARRWLQSPIRALDDIVRSRSPTPSTNYTLDQPPASSMPRRGPSDLMKVLKLLKTVSGTVPGLKSTVEILIYCFDNISDTTRSRQEYQELSAAIAQHIQMLSAYIGESNVSSTGKRVQDTISALNLQAQHISQKQARSGTGRHLDAEDDVEDVMQLYRRLGVLIQQLQNDVTLSVWKNTNESLRVSSEHFANTRLQGLLPALTARYDSVAASQVRRTGCTPKTRELVLQELLAWANNPDGAKVYWMNGMAGTGKTTIAYSLCCLLESANQLAASFFCSQSLPDCRDVARIFPTVAYQLARLCPPFQDAVCRSLAKDPDVGSRGIGRQFEKLICEPMKQQEIKIPNGLLIVVIDALDECGDRAGVKAVLNTLLGLAHELPVRFFVTCRPDQSLLDMVARRGPDGGLLYHLHDIELNMVQDDIETYLTVKMETIDVKDDQIKRLAELSGRLFIYAATIVRYVMNDKASVDHQQRLKNMLDMETSVRSNAHKPIDALYTAVLADALEAGDLELTETNAIRVVLATVICAKEPLSVSSLAYLTGRKSKEVMNGLESLLSVLHVDERTGLVSTLHASFPDYMFDKTRSSRFFCDHADRSEYLARRCFKTMRDLLRFNICAMESSHAFDHEIPNFSDRVDAAVPLHLFYACRYWSDHLFESRDAKQLSQAVEDFLSQRMLFWAEALNLKKNIKAGTAALSNLNSRIKELSPPDNMQALCRDAQKLLAAIGANPVCKSTPHIYISLLALWDRNTPIWRYYGSRTRALAKAGGAAIKSRDMANLTTWKSTKALYALGVSRDGRFIASGGNHGSISIWDAHTGEITVGPFDGHKHHVHHVSFSADGSRVATSSEDNTVRVWDAETGREVMPPIKRHTEAVWGIEYSSDGRYLASGSNDHEVYIWAALTGDLVTGPLRGHTGFVNSVTFALDCRHIASGSNDQTIRIWDVQTGLPVLEPLKGHSGAIYSVAYSPTGGYVTSGSTDCTIRIWDAHTGGPVGQPFQGHTDTVRCVSYSSSGDLIVSGSFDLTVRVWDARSSHTVAGPFTGHTDWVYSVAFMPGDDRVVSCSGDHTIRIWDARAVCTPASLSDAHTGEVHSVAFSPDNRYIVSGGEDCTVRIWDAESGKMRGDTLIGHTDRVWSVAYSCSGRIASGSADGTVRIWDADTGRMLSEPIKGHIGEVHSVALSPDERRVASGSDDCTVRVWDVESGNVMVTVFVGHTELVHSVAYSPDGQHIASCSADNTIRIWDPQTGETCSGPFRFSGNLVSIAYSSDETRIAFSPNEVDVSACDAQTGKVVVGPCVGHTQLIHSVVFSHDGHIISGSIDNTIRIWDAQSGDMVAGPLHAHTNWVKSIACSPDGRLLASGSSDGSIRIWDWHKLISKPQHDRGWWTVNEDGWVVGHDSSLLFWVPPDLRTGLKWPQSVGVIHERGEWELDLSDACIGLETFSHRAGTRIKPEVGSVDLGKRD
ncbi:Vegetative incompatibility protein HET-E-1 [Ceratobasidium sp. AG-Ba]|nr:Vegetative incompatibility protein HET-E-1 [Ceratobasidium sp. AG-Ba]